VAQKISAHDARRAGNQRLLAVRHGRRSRAVTLRTSQLYSFRAIP
jgi:hypothetical protein